MRDNFDLFEDDNLLNYNPENQNTPTQNPEYQYLLDLTTNISIPWGGYSNSPLIEQLTKNNSMFSENNMQMGNPLNQIDYRERLPSRQNSSSSQNLQTLNPPVMLSSAGSSPSQSFYNLLEKQNQCFYNQSPTFTQNSNDSCHMTSCQESFGFVTQNQFYNQEYSPNQCNQQQNSYDEFQEEEKDQQQCEGKTIDFLPIQSLFSDKIIYVNAKQYNRIMKRRKQKLQDFGGDLKKYQEYLKKKRIKNQKNQNRSKHASNRQRDQNGRFLTSQQMKGDLCCAGKTNAFYMEENLNDLSDEY